MVDITRKELLELIEEMGQERFQQYIKIYISQTKEKFNADNFYTTFINYIYYCKSKSKKQCTIISTTSFKFFLKGLDMKQLMIKIEEANNKKDIGDYFYYE